MNKEKFADELTANELDMLCWEQAYVRAMFYKAKLKLQNDLFDFEKGIERGLSTQVWRDN